MGSACEGVFQLDAVGGGEPILGFKSYKTTISVLHMKVWCSGQLPKLLLLVEDCSLYHG